MLQLYSSTVICATHYLNTPSSGIVFVVVCKNISFELVDKYIQIIFKMKSFYDKRLVNNHSLSVHLVHYKTFFVDIQFFHEIRSGWSYTIFQL